MIPRRSRPKQICASLRCASTNTSARYSKSPSLKRCSGAKLQRCLNARWARPKSRSSAAALAAPSVAEGRPQIRPRMPWPGFAGHVELDVPQLAGDEAERSFELREPRLGEIDATLQVFKLFFQIDGHRRTIEHFTTTNQQAARQPRWDLVVAAMPMWPAAVALGILGAFSGVRGAPCSTRTSRSRPSALSGKIPLFEGAVGAA